MNEKLVQIGRLFLKLGLIGFGGPAAHIALMRKEVVLRHKWMDDAQFLDLVGATQLIPGPNSTEMALHIGLLQAGRKGWALAGICFILPAVLLTGILAVAYKQFGQLPAVQPWIFGIKPAIVAILALTIIPLAKQAGKSIELRILGVAILLLHLLHTNELVLLLGAGLYGLLRYTTAPNLIFPWIFLQTTSFNLKMGPSWSVFFLFLKIGSVLYGSGYVLFAFLDTALVSKGLLPRTVLMDAVAVGQFTPGPVFSAVTFIGYQMQGWPGAIAATVGVFLPAFLFVLILNPLIPRMRNSRYFAAFLDAVNMASVAMILGVGIQMGQNCLTSWQGLLISSLSFACGYFFKKINSAFLVLGAALLGGLI